MRSSLRAALMACAVVLAPVAALAQYGGFSGLPEVPLTPGDLGELAAAYQPLLDDDSIPLGTRHEWSNAESGNSGSVALEKRFSVTFEGATLPCRTLRYHFIVKGLNDPYNVRLNRCKMADGTWKIY
jgi:surface antigen